MVAHVYASGTTQLARVSVLKIVHTKHCFVRGISVVDRSHRDCTRVVLVLCSPGTMVAGLLSTLTQILLLFYIRLINVSP
eukprot:scaffold3899_cov393-Prasinococcus_capsulatus_cf.AAC.3